MSDGSFAARVDLRHALRAVARDGAAFVEVAPPRDLHSDLQEDLEAVPVDPAPARVGVVRQETEAATLPRRLQAFPAVAELRRQLVTAVRRDGAGLRGLATWWPDDVSFQRYRPGSIGISPHLDGRRFRRLVAIFTITGRATFRILADRNGPAVREWTPGPGSLVLLRAPGLERAVDGRPFHEVSGPLDGARSTLGFRMLGR